jgi:hypothetical protein
MRIEDVPISQIKVGPRFRHDYGDLDAPAQNIKERGLLQPIGLNSYYSLIFGERRLHACEQLGWTTIPAVISDVDPILFGEHDENEFKLYAHRTRGHRQGDRERIGQPERRKSA